MILKLLVWFFYGVSEISTIIAVVYATVLYSRISVTLSENVDKCTEHLNLVHLLTNADTGITNAVKQALESLPSSFDKEPLKRILMKTLVDQAIEALTVAKDSELARVYTVAHQADGQILDVVSIINEVLFYISIVLLIAAIVALVFRTSHIVLMACVVSYANAHSGAVNDKWMRFASWATQLLAYTACILIVALGVACACIDAYVFNQIEDYVRLIHCSLDSDMVDSGVTTAVFGGVAILTILIEPMIWIVPTNQFAILASEV